MNTKEFVNNIESYIDQLATAASFTEDKHQVQQLRELLYGEAHAILKKRLTAQLANRHADKLLAALRKERRQRLQAATPKTPEPPMQLSIDPETHRTNRVLA